MAGAARCSHRVLLLGAARQEADMPDEFLPRDSFRFTPRQTVAVKRALGLQADGEVLDHLLSSLEWDVYHERAIRAGKGYYLPGPPALDGSHPRVPLADDRPVNDAQQARELRALLKAVDEASQQTIDWVVTGLTDRVRRESSRGPSPTACCWFCKTPSWGAAYASDPTLRRELEREALPGPRLCPRCVPHLYIHATALRDAIWQRLELTLRGVSVDDCEADHSTMTAVRRSDGHSVPARLHPENGLPHPRRGPSDKELRVLASRRFVRAIARTIEEDDGLAPQATRRAVVNLQTLRSLPSLLRVLLCAAGYDLSPRTITTLAAVAREEAKSIRASHTPRRRKAHGGPPTKRPSVRE